MTLRGRLRAGLPVLPIGADLERLLVRLDAPGAHPRREGLRRLLHAALRHERGHADAGRPPRSAPAEEEMAHALVQAASLGEPDEAEEPEELAPEGLFGFLTEPGAERLGAGPYERFDVRWLDTLWRRMTRPKVPFPTHLERGLDPVLPMADRARLALASDWWARTPGAEAVGRRIAEAAADHTVHLGDVYYAGSPLEEARFVEAWPAGTDARCPAFALNSNHEMYDGGAGYYGVALASPKFAAQQGLGYFALENARWLVVGLDTAYHATDYLYQRGRLDPVQLGWLAEVGGRARAQAKRVVLLTHHDGIDFRLAREPLWEQVAGVLEGGPDLWYWGHIHTAGVFRPVVSGDRVVEGRCLGHGGVPFDPLEPTTASRLVWGETGRAADGSGRAPNGFVLLTLDGPSLTEEYRDETGAVRFSRRCPG